MSLSYLSPASGLIHFKGALLYSNILIDAAFLLAVTHEHLAFYFLQASLGLFLISLWVTAGSNVFCFLILLASSVANCIFQVLSLTKLFSRTPAFECGSLTSTPWPHLMQMQSLGSSAKSASSKNLFRSSSRQLYKKRIFKTPQRHWWHHLWQFQQTPWPDCTAWTTCGSSANQEPGKCLMYFTKT